MTTAFSLILAQDYERMAETQEREIKYLQLAMERPDAYGYSSNDVERWAAEVAKLQQERDKNLAEAARLRGTIT
jgi:hypothetical protein